MSIVGIGCRLTCCFVRARGRGQSCQTLWWPKCGRSTSLRHLHMLVQACGLAWEPHRCRRCCRHDPFSAAMTASRGRAHVCFRKIAMNLKFATMLLLGFLRPGFSCGNRQALQRPDLNLLTGGGMILMGLVVMTGQMSRMGYRLLVLFPGLSFTLGRRLWCGSKDHRRGPHHVTGHATADTTFRPSARHSGRPPSNRRASRPRWRRRATA